MTMDDKSITKGAPAALATTPSDAHLDAAVAESLVVRGDVSGLKPAQKTALYLATCKGLGLNPLAQPFAFLKLSGKEVMYAGRGCTDQLARIHHVTREVIDGPKLIDLGGTKLIYCVARATLPSGRFETATATLPFTDPAMVLMKAETKAKRRATLGLLGLALLDESEVADIPASAKGRETVPTLEELSAPVVVAPPLTPRGPSARELNELGVEHPQRAPRPEAPARDREPGDDDDAAQHDPAGADGLECFAADVRGVELPGEAVTVWMAHRKGIEALSVDERKAAWQRLCTRVAELNRGPVKAAAVWLKKACAEEDARRAAAEGKSSDAAA
jgi:hypothetical protein